MKVFLLLFLAGCAVKCNESANNYFVVNMPEEVHRSTPFRVYWNIPTMQCASKKVPFDELFQKYGIVQNKNDRFQGEKITILYDPGLFPAIFNTSGGELRFRNGGVPQDGDYEKHAAAFRIAINETIPDPDYSGIAVIDFESWRPIFRQNWGALEPYKKVSYDLEKRKHWWWPQNLIEGVARSRFEKAGRLFMHNTIALAKKLRPRASWGYYAYPYCYNMKTNTCSDEVKLDNNRIEWLWSESTALFPSVYSSRSLATNQLVAMVSGRIREAARLGRDSLILPYFWYRYRDSGFMDKKDLDAALKTIYESRASGLIAWGSSSDVNTVEKCKLLLEFVTNTFGPSIAQYTKRSLTLNKTTPVTEQTTTVTDIPTTPLPLRDDPNKVDFERVMNIFESMNNDTSMSLLDNDTLDSDSEMNDVFITFIRSAMCDCSDCKCKNRTNLQNETTTVQPTTLDTATTATEQVYITVTEMSTEKSRKCNLDNAIESTTDTNIVSTTPINSLTMHTTDEFDNFVVQKTLCKSKMLEKIIDALPLIELGAMCSKDETTTEYYFEKNTDDGSVLPINPINLTPKRNKEGCFDSDEDFDEDVPDLINNKDQVVRFLLSLQDEHIFNSHYFD